MIVYYDIATKRILSAIDANSPDAEPPKNQGVPLYLEDAQNSGIRNELGNYIIENGVPIYSTLPPSEPTEHQPSEQEQIDNLNKQTATMSDTIDFLLGM